MARALAVRLAGRTTAEEDRLRPFLAAYIRQANEREETVPVISEDNFVEYARRHAATSVTTKLHRLMQRLAAKSSWPGDVAPFDTDREAPLIDAVGPNEAAFLLSHLEQARLVEFITTTVDRAPWSGYRITVAGWERLNPGPGGIPGQCFVAMAFADELHDAYRLGIEPAVREDCRLVCVRIDQREFNDVINDKMMAEIRLAEFVVADVTLQRNGVYFEAGFAMGLGRQVIWSVRDDDFPNIHFDTSHYPYIRWRTPEQLRARLADRIKATIPSAVGGTA